MLRKASEARVDRRLRWYYLIVLLKPEFDSRIGHHVKKGKRGACRQKAAMVLPDRTAAT